MSAFSWKRLKIKAYFNELKFKANESEMVHICCLCRHYEKDVVSELQGNRIIRFHRVPPYEGSLRIKWIKFVQKALPEFQGKGDQRICTLHFAESDYKTDKCIKKGTVPSLHIGPHSYLNAKRGRPKKRAPVTGIKGKIRTSDKRVEVAIKKHTVSRYIEANTKHDDGSANRVSVGVTKKADVNVKKRRYSVQNTQSRYRPCCVCKYHDRKSVRETKKNMTTVLGYHKFPRNVARKKKWQEIIEKAIPHFQLPPWAYICSLHFAKSDYKADRGNRRRNLKSDTVPSLYLRADDFNKDPMMENPISPWSLFDYSVVDGPGSVRSSYYEPSDSEFEDESTTADSSRYETTSEFTSLECKSTDERIDDNSSFDETSAKFISSESKSDERTDENSSSNDTSGGLISSSEGIGRGNVVIRNLSSSESSEGLGSPLKRVRSCQSEISKLLASSSSGPESNDESIDEISAQLISSESKSDEHTDENSSSNDTPGGITSSSEGIGRGNGTTGNFCTSDTRVEVVIKKHTVSRYIEANTKHDDGSANRVSVGVTKKADVNVKKRPYSVQNTQSGYKPCCICKYHDPESVRETKKNMTTVLGYHKFPTNKARKKKWQEIIKMAIPHFQLPTWGYICSLHFAKSDYKADKEYRRRGLKSDTVPSLYLRADDFNKDPMMENPISPWSLFDYSVGDGPGSVRSSYYEPSDSEYESESTTADSSRNETTSEFTSLKCKSTDERTDENSSPNDTSEGFTSSSEGIGRGNVVIRNLSSSESSEGLGSPLKPVRSCQNEISKRLASSSSEPESNDESSEGIGRGNVVIRNLSSSESSEGLGSPLKPVRSCQNEISKRLASSSSEPESNDESSEGIGRGNVVIRNLSSSESSEGLGSPLKPVRSCQNEISKRLASSSSEPESNDESSEGIGRGNVVIRNLSSSESSEGLGSPLKRVRSCQSEISKRLASSFAEPESNDESIDETSAKLTSSESKSDERMDENSSPNDTSGGFTSSSEGIGRGNVVIRNLSSSESSEGLGSPLKRPRSCQSEISKQLASSSSRPESNDESIDENSFSKKAPEFESNDKLADEDSFESAASTLPKPTDESVNDNSSLNDAILGCKLNESVSEDSFYSSKSPKENSPHREISRESKSNDNPASNVVASDRDTNMEVDPDESVESPETPSNYPDPSPATGDGNVDLASSYGDDTCESTLSPPKSSHHSEPDTQGIEENSKSESSTESRSVDERLGNVLQSNPLSSEETVDENPQRVEVAVISNDVGEHRKNSAVLTDIVSIRNSTVGGSDTRTEIINQPLPLIETMPISESTGLEYATETDPFESSISELVKSTPRKRKSFISFDCKICVASFSKSEDLREHRRWHVEQKYFKCGFCDKVLSSQYAWEYHVNVHAGYKPYTCDHCEKEFVTRQALKSHRCKKYKCRYCAKTFAIKSKLKEHRKTHLEEKLYRCDVCDKHFFKKSSLNTHMAKHKPKETFKCEYCGNVYQSKEELKYHLKMTGENLVICATCLDTFEDYLDFKLHLLTHKKEESFVCTVCDRTFVSMEILEDHILTHDDRANGAF